MVFFKSVGKKLYTGFSLITAFMVLAIITVIITTMSNYQSIRELQSLTRQRNDFYNVNHTFYSAQDKGSILGITPTVENHNIFAEYQALCREAFNTLQEASTQTNFDAEVRQTISKYETWSAEIEEIYENSVTMERTLILEKDNVEQLYNYAYEFQDIVLSQVFDDNRSGQTQREQLEGIIEVINTATTVYGRLDKALESTATIDVTITLGFLNQISESIDAIPLDNLSDDAIELLDSINAIVRESQGQITPLLDIRLQDDLASAYVLEGEIMKENVDTALEIAGRLESLIASIIQKFNFTLIFLTVLTAIAIILSFVLSHRITSSITRPLNIMKNILEDVVYKGDIHLTPEKNGVLMQYGAGPDEVGQSMKALHEMFRRLNYVSSCLEQVASQDLTVNVVPLSEKDSMVHSLQKMIANLHTVIGEIKSFSQIISTSAVQMDSSATQLASSNAEQASTTEQLSISVEQIVEHSRDSLKKADKALEMGNEISESVENSSENLNSMQHAMVNIENSIKKIIEINKTIEDISFKTNLLSLNASVEAARAGIYGKGFSVIAGEIRSLAGQCAEAARNTAQLINISIEETVHSIAITKDATSSFGDVIEKATKSSTELSVIANLVNSQFDSLKEISNGISNIAQVTELNGSISEENAAVSSEVNTGVQKLQNIINRFKLEKDHNNVVDLQRAEKPVLELVGNSNKYYG